MKYFILVILVVLSSVKVSSQDMDNEQLDIIFNVVSDTLRGGSGAWEFVIEDVFMMCITDQVNNRIRIISAIRDMKDITDEEIGDAMEANFHSVLDVRYAISDNLMWVAFIHPLRELNEDQVLDAVAQVYSATLTFGTTYASTNLSFPKAEKGKKVQQQKY